MKPIYLRLSIFEECNLRCAYCRPAREVRLSQRRERLNNEELVSLVDCMSKTVPLYKLRLTGGEPLLRPDLVDLVGQLRGLLPDCELCLTSNGTRLAGLAHDLRAAGLDRLNVSLDCVDPQGYAELTRGGDLKQVLAGLEAAEQAGFRGTKLNAVLLNSFAPKELLELVRFAALKCGEIRFIELMPISVAAGLHRTEYLSADDAREMIEQGIGPMRASDPDSGIAKRLHLDVDGRELVVGFIPSVSEPFCKTCDRLRVDSRGRLFACLRNPDWLDLGEPVRRGDLEEARVRIGRVLEAKCPPESVWPGRQMSSIGG